MPHVSRRPLKPYIKQDILQEFWYTLGILNTKDIYILFKEVLSPTEVIMLSKRLAILRSLRDKTDYESIHKVYQVSNTTISNVNKLLMKLPTDTLKIVDRIVEAEKVHWENKKNSKLIRGSKLVFARHT